MNQVNDIIKETAKLFESFPDCYMITFERNNIDDEIFVITDVKNGLRAEYDESLGWIYQMGNVRAHEWEYFDLDMGAILKLVEVTRSIDKFIDTIGGSDEG